MQTRNIVVEVYTKVSNVLNDWWAGRSMTHLLPRLFFEHFQPTSFVIEKRKRISLIYYWLYFTNESERSIHTFCGRQSEVS